MMKKIIAFLFLCSSISSCFLFNKYRKTTFTYMEGTQSYSLPVLVPKGYTKKNTEVDSAGNTKLEYYYAGKTLFYIVHVADTSFAIQPIVEKDNIAKINSAGAKIYKGLDADNLFWREIRKKNIRIGYRYVPSLLEATFDSATNYAALRKLK